MNNEYPSPNNPERTIFQRALELKSLKERNIYLDEACGNDNQLRNSVESLLRHHRENSVLTDMSHGVRQNPTAAIKAGDIIDGFTLINEIGRGSGGIVFVAEQHTPINRLVAIKFLTPKVAALLKTGQLISEINALAKLDHTNIAKVFTAGGIEENRPYFTMELIKDGKTITDYADTEDLTISDRLKLFATICKAVHHAHLNGVIHRDIKPENVLLTIENRSPLPKLIDFGISKATVGDRSNPQMGNAIVGTVNYMSPEQARPGGKEIDRRTDIYSLGVLLYKLLSGCLPFESDEKDQKETLRAIAGEVPLAPSIRYANLHEKEYLRIAQCRSATPSELKEWLKRFDSIILKCLEKDPQNRYETAESLATAVENQLSGPPQIDGPQKRRGQRQPLKRMVVASLVSLVLLGGCLIWKFITPDVSTPEGLLTVLYKDAYNPNKTQFVRSHQTEVGVKVWDWLVHQTWFKDKGIGKITGRLNAGGQQSLVLEYETVLGVDKLAVVFFTENEILKFHDVYIYELEGDKYNETSAKLF